MKDIPEEIELCPRHQTVIDDAGTCIDCIENSVSAGDFPEVGKDITPTREMLEKGKHGNGSWNLTDGSVQVAYAEMHQQKKEARDERLQHFNNEAKDQLSEAVKLHGRVIALGNKIMDDIENGEKVNGAMLSLLSKALGSSKELTDRAAGKAKASGETIEKQSALMFLIGGTEEND